MRFKDLITLSFTFRLILALCCCQNLWGQSYITDVHKLSVEDGLSNRFVNVIYRDSRGFMWIGTQNGLNRYDGYEFKHYTKENSTITANNIRQICEDAYQKLWLIQQINNTEETIDILDLQTGRIQSFDSIFKSIAPFEAESVSTVHSNIEKTLWIATTSGEIYRYKNKRFKHIFTTIKQEYVHILYANENFLWFHYGRPHEKLKSLVGIDLKTGKVKEFGSYTDLISTSMDEDNALWFFHPKQKTFLKTDWEKQAMVVADISRVQHPGFNASVTFAKTPQPNPFNDFIWWSDTKNNDVPVKYNFPSAYHIREGFSYNFRDKMAQLMTYKNFSKVNDACFDMKKRLWMATRDGIFIVSLKKNKFTTITANKQENYSTRGITEDDQGNIYINTYGGRLLVQPEKGVVKSNFPFNGLAVTKDREGKLWFSGGHLIVEKYDPLSGKSRYYTYFKEKNDEPLGKQWTLISDAKGHIWLGSNKGIYTLDPETEHFQKFIQYNAFKLLKNSSIYHLREAKEGIWIASSSGLYLLESGKGITTRYTSEENSPRQIPYNHILHFHRDAEGVFWLGTKGGGLIRFDPGDGSSRQFTTKDGLSSNTIYAVYEDDYGKLWLPSDYGLMRFDKRSYHINTYLKGDGIAHNEFNTASHYQSAGGHLYFGGLSGVTIFHPKDFITDDPVPVPLRITACEVLNGKTGTLINKTETVSASGKLLLSPSDRSLALTFALLNYQNVQNNSYAYKVEGLGNNWASLGSSNRLQLNNLPYGSYTLHIKGQGIKGQWSEDQLAIAITATPPFYRQKGFIAAGLLILGLLICGICHLRLQRLKRSQIRLKEIVKARTQEIQQQRDKIEQDKNTITQQAEELKTLNATQSRWFTNIAHELRTPLTLILGPARQLLETASQKTTAEAEHLQLVEKNSRSLLKLVNQIMDVSRMESGRIKLQKEPVQLSRLVKTSVANFESFAHQKGVHLMANMQDHPIVLIDKERIQNILVNLISNALKFTHNDGMVTVTVKHKAGNGVTVTVADTGDGIPERDLPHIFERYYQASDPKQVNQGGAGIGLALALELARLHGGDIAVQSQLGKGSIFTLFLPKDAVISNKPEQLVQTDTIEAVSPKTTSVSLDDIITNGQQKKPHVLLVEDNPDMRAYIRNVMKPTYEVAEATDGVEALEHLKKTTPDLIISDIMMPRMDGITLAKALKKEERLKSIPFISLTARSGEADKMTALRIGIDDYLSKPFQAEELQVRTANLIRNHRMRRASFTTDPGEITKPNHRTKLITAMRATVIKQLQNNVFNAYDLAASQHMSLSTLQRFLKKATGLTPSQFIREIRLQRALKLLEAGQYPTLSEVVYAVGFKNISYFIKLFSARFGKKPAEYF